ncbi:MAG: pyridoxal phosphate-dependent aminotransferase [Bacillota bacterium]|jgi:aspartate aminotransferase
MRLAQRALSISPSPTLAIDARAKKMMAAGEKVINFGVGEPDFDTPDNIKAAAIEAINRGLTKYTAVAGTDQLRQAIVDKFKKDNGLDYKADQIVVSVGAKHSLYNTFQVLCQEGDEVILPAPYWVSYLEQIKLAGASPVIVQTRASNNFKLTVEELESVVTKRTRLIIMNSPSNPTGAVYSRDELAALGEVFVRQGIVVISDEIYEKLIYDGHEHVSIAALSSELKDLTVVINGVSKSYAMTGWRIGYAAAPEPVARAMADLQSHSTSNPTSIAQAASVEALVGDQSFLAQMLIEFDRRRRYMVDRLRAVPGVNCNLPGGAFYVFPEISAFLGRSYKGKVINGATDLADVLLSDARVAVVPGVAFGDDRCFRLSYATSMDKIQEGLNRLEAVLNEIN